MISNELVTNYIKWADISLYLSENDFQKERYMNWVNQTKKSRLIYMVNEIVKWGQPNLIGVQGFDEVCLLLYSLIGNWLLKATAIAQTGTGLVIGTPITSTLQSGAGTLTIIVGATGSPIPANSNQYTNTILINRVLIVILNNLVVQGSPVPGFAYIFNKDTGTLTFTNNLSNGQSLTIIYI